jgi:hypothetical protein
MAGACRPPVAVLEVLDFRCDACGFPGSTRDSGISEKVLLPWCTSTTFRRRDKGRWICVVGASPAVSGPSLRAVLGLLAAEDPLAPLVLRPPKLPAPPLAPCDDDALALVTLPNAAAPPAPAAIDVARGWCFVRLECRVQWGLPAETASSFVSANERSELLALDNADVRLPTKISCCDATFAFAAPNPRRGLGVSTRSSSSSLISRLASWSSSSALSVHSRVRRGKRRSAGVSGGEDPPWCSVMFGPGGLAGAADPPLAMRVGLMGRGGL